MGQAGEASGGFVIESMDELNKIYVEPTNRCNLACVTCIRHAWDEPFGDMEWTTYQALIDGLSDFPGAKTIAFAGLGEPLLHERFPEMIQLAYERGFRTEMTSNAMLLTPSLAAKLIEAGLDQLVVSIDGASSDALGAVRPGASLNEITTNIRLLNRLSRQKTKKRLRIGIEFVAMKRNVHELPVLRKIAHRISASFILVTNVLPYMTALQDEILYKMGMTSYDGDGTRYNPRWILPHMDWNLNTQGPLSDIMRRQPKLSFLDINLTQRKNHCPFIMTGSMAVAWHGGVSPCPALLHSYPCFIRNREKFFRRCEFGKLPGQSLTTIWMDAEYAAFRKRVRQFDFPPCIDCGGCDWAEKNEKDCYGNPFPVCGDCLWARGILQCA